MTLAEMFRLVAVVLTMLLPGHVEASDRHEWQPFEATAYTSRCDGCTGITKSGVDVRQTTLYEGRTVIAVDPDVIPLGSELEVRLEDGTIIEGTAQDIGSSIKGERIDIIHATKSEARQFGRQAVDVRIIDR